jgi:hypothetical protein
LFVVCAPLAIDSNKSKVAKKNRVKG